MASQQPILNTTKIFFGILELTIMLAMLYFAAEGVLNENGFQLLGTLNLRNTLLIICCFFSKKRITLADL